MKSRRTDVIDRRASGGPALIEDRQIAGHRLYGRRARRKLRFGSRRMTRSSRRDTISYRRRACPRTRQILFLRILSRPLVHIHLYACTRAPAHTQSRAIGFAPSVRTLRCSQTEHARARPFMRSRVNYCFYSRPSHPT